MSLCDHAFPSPETAYTVFPLSPICGREGWDEGELFCGSDEYRVDRQPGKAVKKDLPPPLTGGGRGRVE